MGRKIIESCPSCGGGLEITEVRCTQCDTVVRSRYEPCEFCSLTDEQTNFLRIFVMSRGNMSDVEKRLGVSYPTVRAKLDEVIQRLGERSTSSTPARSDRQAILDAVARGELSPAEGLQRIRSLGQK